MPIDPVADVNWLEDHPDRVRPKLKMLPSGSWSVFETLAANGSLAIGISPRPLPANAAMVVYEGLTRAVAEQAAAGYHRWRLGQTTC